MRIIEFFCGIGGVAAAVGRDARIVAAVDISRAALGVYGLNFSHPTVARELETIPEEWIGEWNADLWWMSPPCQPYTSRGRQRDLDDPRARSLLTLIQRIGELRPPYVGIENVPAFAVSRARGRLCEALERCGYAVGEQIVCPTELGLPMQRRRYYLTAAREAEAPLPGIVCGPQRRIPLKDFLLESADRDPSLAVEATILGRYRSAIHVVDRDDPDAMAHCFTSAYGRSHVRSGSYLRAGRGVRRFSPAEILRLLGFGAAFRLPPHVSHRKGWELVGNSLSVDVVRRVLEPTGACGRANESALYFV